MVLQRQRPYPGKGLPQPPMDVAAKGRTGDREAPPSFQEVFLPVPAPTTSRGGLANTFTECLRKTAYKPIGLCVIYKRLTSW